VRKPIAIAAGMRLATTSGWLVALLAVLVAFGFLGSRGLWDPDEGRYTNVALNMLDSGDWLNPRRNDEVGHWTKPPLTYWAIAASVAVFGANPWAARLPMALCYLACVWLSWRIARRLAPGTEVQAALAFATMLLTVGAAQLVTTDFLLAACTTLAMWGFVEARFGDAGLDDASMRPKMGPAHWIAVMWGGLALAFLAKGPPALLPLLVVVAFDLLMPRRHDHRVFNATGIALFALLALPWYIAVIRGHPGLLEYFIGDEVVNRLASNEFVRHGEWYGWAEIYLPTLLLGTLPWTPALLRWSRHLPAALRRWRDGARVREAEAGALLLALWLLLPLLVFCMARSRMPLYLLPLFVPLSIIAAMQRSGEGRAPPRLRWLLAWVAILLALKLAAAHWPTHKNAQHWATAIRERAGAGAHEIVFVEDMARYGLHLHMGRGTEIELIALDPGPWARFNPLYDETLAQELAEHEAGVVWVCKQELWLQIRARIAAQGYRTVALGKPYQHRIIFRVERTAASSR
jgi:4-amino-4-deoxy-L-arabinose transferase-like glycosyltransferase